MPKYPQRRGRKTVAPFVRRGRMVRKYGKKRIPKPLALKQHNFVERHTSEFSLAVAKTEGVAIMHGKSFSLDDVRQADHYKALFEYYRIDKVICTIRYKNVGPIANLAAAANQYALVNEINPILIFKVDHNEVDTETIDTMKDSMKCKRKMLTNDNPEFTIVLKPAVQAEAFKSALSTTYVPKWGQWLSTDDGSVPHYGLKLFALGTDYLDNCGSVQISYKTYFSMKCNE